MRLVADASLLVAEALRVRGRDLLAVPDLDLVVAEDAWSETEHEIGKRVDHMIQRGHLDVNSATALLDEAINAIADRVTLVPTLVYANRLNEARARIPRDERDAPTVALALTLDCAIWTNDHDFFGCGVPIWVTETLLGHLETNRSLES